MSSKKIQTKNPYEEIHEELQNSMKKEISTMREVLSNMREEEISLLSRNNNYLDLLLEKRDDLVSYLSNLRLIRVACMQKLSSLFLEASEEDPSSLNDTQKCETLLLCDQITALAEKIHLQNRSNLFLSHHLEHQLIPLEEPKKRKIYLQTEEP